MCVFPQRKLGKTDGFCSVPQSPVSVSEFLMFFQFCLKSCCTFSDYGLISWYSLIFLMFLDVVTRFFWGQVSYFRQDLNMEMLVVKAAVNILEPRLSGCTCTTP